jgi:DHA1 family tetracycline resistance protein-like MFS transporter
LPDLSEVGKAEVEMAVLFLVVFVDLLGFGLLIPLLPFYVQHLGAGPELITLVLSLYSLAQFFSAPVWGRLSDRHGRKPILVVTSFGLAVSYLMLGYADSLTMLIAARLFGGLMAGNISAAQAYIADITTPEGRAKGMGLIGAAFGLGFIFGPAIGGLLGGRDLATANFFLPAVTAAAITLLAAIGAQFALKESLTDEIRLRLSQRSRLNLGTRLRATFSRAALIMLVAVGFLTVTGWAQLESVFALWANQRLQFGPRNVAFVLSFVGIVSVAIQVGVIGPLTERFGERHVAAGSLVILALGFALMASASGLPQTLIASATLAAGFGLFNPSLPSLVSQEAQDHERGAVLGTYQGAISLSRAVGPAFSGLVFARLGMAAPFLVSIALIVPALMLLLALPAGKRPALTP